MFFTSSVKDNDIDVCQTGQAYSRTDKVAVYRTKVTWRNAAAFQHPYGIQTFACLGTDVFNVLAPLEVRFLTSLHGLFRHKNSVS